MSSRYDSGSDSDSGSDDIWKTVERDDDAGIQMSEVSNDNRGERHNDRDRQAKEAASAMLSEFDIFMKPNEIHDEYDSDEEDQVMHDENIEHIKKHYGENVSNNYQNSKKQQQYDEKNDYRDYDVEKGDAHERSSGNSSQGSDSGDDDYYEEDGNYFGAYDDELNAFALRRRSRAMVLFLVFIQVVIFIAMSFNSSTTVFEKDTIATKILVNYGCKNAFMIIEKGEYWRLISSLFLHSSFSQLLCLSCIQIIVGTYVNVLFGLVPWLVIYAMSGIVGTLISCSLLPHYLGTGTNGALLGTISAWIVWIILRWNLRLHYQFQRNIHLFVAAGILAWTVFWGLLFLHETVPLLASAVEGALLSVFFFYKKRIKVDDDENYESRNTSAAAGIMAFGFFVLSFIALMSTKLEGESDYHPTLYGRND